MQFQFYTKKKQTKKPQKQQQQQQQQKNKKQKQNNNNNKKNKKKNNCYATSKLGSYVILPVFAFYLMRKTYLMPYASICSPF